jgi:hypothetical protein
MLVMRQKLTLRPSNSIVCFADLVSFWCGCANAFGSVPKTAVFGRIMLAQHSTIRADSRPSLQVRGGSASTARADIHIAEKLSFFLHRRKAASSPKCRFSVPQRRSGLRKLTGWLLKLQPELKYAQSNAKWSAR